jgi:hypothetical protein
MPNPAQPADPAGSVDRFAELSALLADPFADRAAILCEAGLDAERWRAVEEGWAGRLQEDGAIAERFAAVYLKTVRALGAPALPLAQAGYAPDGGPSVLPATEAGPEPLVPPPTQRSPEPPPSPRSSSVTPDVDHGATRSAVPLRPLSSPPSPFGETLEAATRLPVPGRSFNQS